MPVGMIGGQTTSQPQHSAQSERLAQNPLDLFAAPSGVAVGIQQALRGAQGRTLAGEVQGAPFAPEFHTPQRARDYGDDEGQDKQAPPNMERLGRAEYGTSLVGRLYGKRSVEDERNRLLPEDESSGGGSDLFADESPEPVAEAKKVGRLFHFRVKTPVDLPRRRSSMLMISLS